LVRARITAALEYMARVRVALPDSLLTESAVALTGAETALRQALRDLPDSVAGAGERRHASPLPMESTPLDRGRPVPPADEPVLLDLHLQLPGNDDAAATSTSWRF
jgi:hypothetical protein